VTASDQAATRRPLPAAKSTPTAATVPRSSADAGAVPSPIPGTAPEPDPDAGIAPKTGPSTDTSPQADPSTGTATKIGPAGRAERPVRVLLVDAAPMQRSGLRMAVAASAGLAVAGEAGDGVEAVDLARRLLPDVVVMDIALPRMDGLTATRALRDAGLPVRVLILAAHDGDEHVIGAIAAGAAGFLRKDVPAGDLIAAIRAVDGHGAVIAPRVLARLLPRFAEALPDPATTATDALSALTDREREVLVHVARGHSNAEIARALTISETTIKTHVGHVLTKLRLRDRVQAVVLAYETGLVKPGT
jgi:DNA-binding NarL/FixJ family response regulator